MDSLRANESALRVVAARPEAARQSTSLHERELAVLASKTINGIYLNTTARILYVLVYRQIDPGCELVEKVIYAGQLCGMLGVDSATVRHNLKQLIASGLFVQIAADRQTGALTVRLRCPFEVGIARPASRGDEQADLNFGSICSAVGPVEGKCGRGSAPPPGKEPAAGAAFRHDHERQEEPARGIRIDADSARSARDDQNLSKSDLSLKPSNLSDLSNDPEAQLLAAEVEKLRQERGIRVDADPARNPQRSARGEPRPIIADVAAMIERIEPAPAARLESIDGLCGFIRSWTGNNVESDLAIDAIASHVFSKSFPENLLRSCLQSYAKQKRAGAIHCQPGWYFLTSIQAAARRHGSDLYKALIPIVGTSGDRKRKKR